MKILVLGRGVIGTIYGWALEQAGHEVELLVRPGSAARYGTTVDLDLLDGRRRRLGERVVRPWPVVLREHLEPDHDVDLIIVSVGHHRLAAAAGLLAPRVGGATVLVFGNIWDEPTAAVAPLPLDRVVWGFPQAGGGYDSGNHLRGGLMRTVVLGTVGATPTRREQAVREMFAAAGFAISDQPDIRGWLWVHVVADAGMHAEGLRPGSLSRLIGRPGGFREALLTSRELMPLLAARGVDLRRHRAAVLPFRLARVVAPAISLLTRHAAIARVSLEAHTDGYAEEPRRVVHDVLAEARRLQVPVPRLEAAAALMADR